MKVALRASFGMSVPLSTSPAGAHVLRRKSDAFCCACFLSDGKAEGAVGGAAAAGGGGGAGSGRGGRKTAAPPVCSDVCASPRNSPKHAHRKLELHNGQHRSEDSAD